MKNRHIQVIITVAMLAIASFGNAQMGTAINTSGNSNYTGAILDLSNKNTTGTYGFLPPYVFLTNATVLTTPITGGAQANLSGLVVYNTNTSTSNGLNGPGLYYWNNTLSTPSWVFLGSGNSSANNGTSLNGSSIQLGGNNLIQTTNIPLNNNKLLVQGSSDTTIFTATGQTGIGNTAPNSKAVVDLTNATNLGLKFPGITTANLPAIAAAQNGLVVFNTTIGCPEIAVGGKWYVLGLVHGSTTYSYTTNTIQHFTVPSCVISITIVANGGVGGEGYGNATSPLTLGGFGATVINNGVAVTPGEVLDIVCGEAGEIEQGGGGGGGGGTFVWENGNTTTSIVIAGGGGGGGGSGSAGNNAGITTAGNGALGNTGGSNSGGVAGNAGTGADAGGAGGGWNTTVAQEQPTAATAKLGQGGAGEPGSFAGGSGATAYGGYGGYGGGGGGGASNNDAGGGGGGGGRNGGGGGDGTGSYADEYGGGGGGSAVNGSTNPSSASAGWNNSGSVIIYW